MADRVVHMRKILAIPRSLEVFIFAFLLHFLAYRNAACFSVACPGLSVSREERKRLRTR